MKVSELLVILKKNLKEHQETFETAWKQFLIDYDEEAEKLKEEIKSLEPGASPKFQINLLLPENHSRDYERAITMLEMHQDDTIPLNEDEVTKYVMNDWRWSRDWASNTRSYSQKFGG